jgi:hypothetical protein
MQGFTGALCTEFATFSVPHTVAAKASTATTSGTITHFAYDGAWPGPKRRKTIAYTIKNRPMNELIAIDVGKTELQRKNPRYRTATKMFRAQIKAPKSIGNMNRPLDGGAVWCIGRLHLGDAGDVAEVESASRPVSAPGRRSNSFGSPGSDTRVILEVRRDAARLSSVEWTGSAGPCTGTRLCDLLARGHRKLVWVWPWVWTPTSGNHNTESSL